MSLVVVIGLLPVPYRSSLLVWRHHWLGRASSLDMVVGSLAGSFVEVGFFASPLNNLLNLAGSVSFLFSIWEAVKKAMPEDSSMFSSGVLVMRSAPLSHPSSDWWLAAFAVLVAIGQLLLWIATPASPPISSAGSLLWRGSASSHALKVVVVVSTKHGRDGGPDRVGAQSRWLIWRGLGASVGVRLPACFILPSHVQAERRSFLYLQAMVPKGGQ